MKSIIKPKDSVHEVDFLTMLRFIVDNSEMTVDEAREYILENITQGCDTQISRSVILKRPWWKNEKDINPWLVEFLKAHKFIHQMVLTGKPWYME